MFCSVHNVLPERRSRIAVAMLAIVAAVSLDQALTVLPTLAAASRQFSNFQVGRMQGIVYKYPDVFGGLVGDPASHQVTIAIAPTAPRARRDEALAELAAIGSASDRVGPYGRPIWSLATTSGGPSLSLLRSVQDQIQEPVQWQVDGADNLVSYGIDPVSHSVVVGLRVITPAMLRHAAAYEHVRLVAAVPAKDASRTIDSQPYWGGDALVTNPWGVVTQCTAAFAAYDGSTGSQGMLTAGHCWGNGTTVQQGYWDGSCCVHTSGNMGTVTHRSYGNGVPDIEFLDANAIGSNVAPWVYTSTYNGDYVSQAAYDFVGEGVCTDGWVTGENCTGSVVATNICQQDAQGTNICGLSKVTANSTLCQEGDSGGPVYNQSPIVALGLISLELNGTQCWYTDLINGMSAINVGLITR